MRLWHGQALAPTRRRWRHWRHWPAVLKVLLSLTLWPGVCMNLWHFLAAEGGSAHMRLTQRNNHANISELLDNLLRGYDNSIRPDFGGPPATVEVDIMVRSMGPISEVDMTYSMDCYFRQSWVDTRLAFEGAQDTLALSVSMLARIWKPDTYFYNGKQSYLHTITTPNKFVRIYQNGRVLYSSRLTIKAGCPMNLEDFPMDIQKCPLKFGSFGYTTADVIYRWNKERPAVAIAEDMKLSQFDLVDCPAGNLTDVVYKAAAPNTVHYPTAAYDHNTDADGDGDGDDADDDYATREGSRHNHRNYDYKGYNPSGTASHGGSGGSGGSGAKKHHAHDKKAPKTFAGPGAKNQHVRGTGLQLDKGAFGSGRGGGGGGGGHGGGGGGGNGVGNGGAVRLETSHASEYSMLMVNFHLQRHMGNFLIQVYGPCCLLVVLSWVSFWLNREATADRVSLGITTVLTMTFLGLEARTDLPKVPYLTALDFFVFLSFAFIFATILQFAVVHYFTKYGSGECYFIIEEVDSDTESEMVLDPLPSGSGVGAGGSRGTTTGAAAAAGVGGVSGGVGIASDFDTSTESKIYEVIPLAMCSIVMPSGGGGGGVGCGGKDSASSSGIGIGIGPCSSTSASASARRRRAAERRSRRYGSASGSDSGVYSFSCFGWSCFRRRDATETRNDFAMSDDDDEEAHLRAGETDGGTPRRSTGRRRMSYYRREELEARRRGKRTPQYNSVSKIDRASRVVFPLLFFLINVFYWYGYLSRSSRILAHAPSTT